VDGSDVIETAFAMPLTSPSFPRGPYRYANREHLIVTHRTNRTALELAVSRSRLRSASRWCGANFYA
jgi:acetoacetate decarboxylase